MLDSLDRRAANALRLENTLRSLRDEASNAPAQADREGVVRRISSGYTEILKSWRYPKIELSLIDANLVPHMKGSDYTNASSGGRTLISASVDLGNL